MHLRLLPGMLVLLLCAAVQVLAPARAAEAQPGYATLLAEADALRSSQPKRFGELLDALERRSSEGDAAQLSRLKYLRAYWWVVYGGDVDGGIAMAKLLFDEATDPDLRFRAGSLVVNSYAINRNFTDGLRFLNKTLPLRHGVTDRDIRHDGTNVAAVIHNQLGQHEIALGFAEETLADVPNPRAGCFAGAQQVEAQYFLGKLPKSDAAIAAVVAQCETIGERITANFARAIQARHLAAAGQRTEAIALLAGYMEQVDGFGYPRLIAEFRSLLAELSLQGGDLEAAEMHAHATTAQELGASSTRALAAAYETLYEIASRRDDPVAALVYYRSYSKADKAWLNEVKARELAYQIVHQETSQKSQQIELLNRQNEVLQLQQRVQEQSAQNSRLLVLLLLLLLASIGFWAYKTKRVQMSLRRMAETDALTGVCNRHHFTQRANAALARCSRMGEDVALVMFDLDRFKSINDRFGHSTGDWVLQRVVATCQPLCRQIDTFGRLGGEEFAILLIGCDARAAKRTAEDCRVRLAGIDTGDSGHSFMVSASFGVTGTELSGYDLTRLLSHADRMLYRAKRGGRNRACVYEIPMPTAVSRLEAGFAEASPEDAPEAAAPVAGMAGADPDRRAVAS